MSTTALSAPVRARGTTVALKMAMAVSGIIFVLFVLAHMYGNFKAFSGAAAFDDYAHHLRVMGEPILPYGGMLWIARVVLLVALVVHVWAAATLWRRARVARGSAYQKVTRLEATYSARLMRWGGIILLLFIVFHILHFTTLTFQIGGDYDAMGPFARMVVSFANPFVYLAYFIAMAALALHVRHGVWSALATLGANRERRTGAINAAAIVVAVLLFVGFLAAPTAILLGLIS